MKNKIAFKLTLYFSAALLLFSLIIGGLFLTLFKSHTMELYKTDMEKRAATIAETLSGYMGKEGGVSGMMGGRQGGYGAYLRFLDEIAMSDVWIVDENLDVITNGPMAEKEYNYTNLPPDAEWVVKEVFSGKTTFSEGFSDLLNTPTLTVGTPITSKGKVIGALLLHSPVEGMEQSITPGLTILAISMAIALLLSVLLSVLLAMAFTKPLKKMQSCARMLSEGDYSAKTGVWQKDEIGELAQILDTLSERLAAASRESEKLDQLRRDFVANISHELRTPVTVIRGSLEALCDEVVTDPEQVKSYHRQMLRESLFLQRLVNDLLDLSRLQNTDFQIEMQDVSLCDLLVDVVRSADHMAQAKQIEIQKDLDRPNCMVSGDYGRLRQMLLIILDNAIKFSPSGGIIHVALKENVISVKDHGIGIAPKDLPYIFDRFYKARSEENKNGTGLGLAIAKQIADRHNILISVSSLPNEGTGFYFHLPQTSNTKD